MSESLPIEIVVEILYRLPAKTLVKCTSVCKSWRSLITHPSFISDHLLRPNDHFLPLQLFNENDDVRYSLHRDNDLLSEFSTLDLPRSFEREFSIVGICNGLVCITSSPECNTLIVCNPCIRRYVSLPRPRYYPGIYAAGIGFGFDSGTNDYRVVRIACMMNDKRYGLYGLCAPKVEVYSLATGFWKSITAVPPVCLVDSYASHAFIDGIVHWGATHRRADGWYCFILSFDLRDEVFGEIMLPHCLANVSFDNAITVIGCEKSLAVYHVNSSASSHTVWVMRVYGVVESWNKLFTFNWTGFNLEVPFLEITLTGVLGPPKVICCRNSREVLLHLDYEGKECLYLLDAEWKRFTDLKIGGDGDGCIWYRYSGYYAESLVLSDKASSLVSY